MVIHTKESSRKGSITDTANSTGLEATAIEDNIYKEKGMGSESLILMELNLQVIGIMG
jgi:hypothetical protein